MTKSKKIIRSVLCTVLSFLLALSLTLIGVLCVMKFTVLNPRFTARIAEKSGYAREIWLELKDEFVSYGNACNIDESFFDGIFETVITEKTIDDYPAESITGLYEGRETEPDLTGLYDQLLSELKVYAADKGFVLDETLNDNLKNMSSEMCDIYRTFAGMFDTSYFKTAFSVMRRYMPVFNKVLIGLCIFAVLTMIVIRLFFAKAKNYLRYYIYAACGSTLMLAVAPAAAMIMKLGSRINVENASLYNFASGFINSIVVGFLIAATIMAAFALVIIIIRLLCIKRETKTAAED